MHNALDRAVGVVADRIGAFPLPAFKLTDIRHELAGDRIVRIGAIDQVGDGRRDGDGVSRCDLLQRAEPLAADKPRVGEVARAAQGLRCAIHRRLRNPQSTDTPTVRAILPQVSISLLK